ncbi:transcriptional repressor LexA [Patescibacteria group bacterium]|nr:transcriptional repressor LexA [Patescibacteria group bacterium]MBU1885427.1 transcriptional repressor LexA [Patescibacteria group bacterium]
MKFSTLTNKQQEVLEIVMSYLGTSGESPSLRDIQKQAQSVSSMRGITLQLDALEEAGFIRRDPKTRAITLSDSLANPNNEFIEIPLLLGSVPAGTPSMFEEFIDRHIPVKLSATKGLRNVYAIKVRGDSMNEANIIEGDHAIVTPSPVANNGDIVLALVDNELTIKKFRLVNDYPILFPESDNKSHKPIAGNFSVRGKLINIIKPELIQLYQKSKLLTTEMSIF